MACKELFLAFALMTPATVALASQAPSEGAPPAPDSALYCLKMEPITGTRIGSILCWTREQWAENDIDLDEAWAEDGVEVIGG
jgi:hypothetical protein